MARERLQKILAHAGLASRRSAEALISAGKVRVNGLVVSELGASADPRKDKIEVEGKRIVLEKPVYYVLHKPRGMVTTLSDPEGRPHLGEMLKKIDERVYPVGRLDFHTSGVLLVTNDGELTEALLHPRKDVPKTYVAKLRGFVHVEELDKLRNGVVLDDGHKTKKAEVFVLREEERNTWVQITLHEGKNRQIHRMGEAIGHPVLRLARISFAGITAEGLRPGEWRELDARELEKLKKAYITPMRQSKDRELEHAMRAAAKKLRASTEAPESDDDSDEPSAPGADRAVAAPEKKAPRAKLAPRAPSSRGTWADARTVDEPSESAPERKKAPRAKPAPRAPSSRGTWAEPRGSAARNEPSESSAPAPRGAKASRPPARGAAAKPRAESSEPRGGKARASSSDSRGGSSRGPSSDSRGGSSRGPSSESRGGSSRGPSSDSRGDSSRGPSSESRGGSSRKPFSQSRDSGSRGAPSQTRDSGSRDATPRGAPSYSRDATPRGAPSYSRDSGPRKPSSQSRDSGSRGAPSQSRDSGSRGASSQSRDSGSRGAPPRGGSAKRPSGSRRDEPREGGESGPRDAKPRGGRHAESKPRTPRTRRS